MTPLLKRTGLVAPIIAAFTVVAIGLHVAFLQAAPFLWTEVGRSVFFTFQRPFGLCLLAFGLLAGLAFRFRQQGRPLGDAIRSLANPDRRWLAMGGAAVAVTLAFAFNDERSALDWVAAAVLGAIAGGWQPDRNTRGRPAVEVAFVLSGFLAISYAFTVIKACLFVGGEPTDAALVDFVNRYAGGTVYQSFASWGQGHMGWVRALDDFYLRIFDQMAAVSLFLIGAGKRSERIVFQSALALCYLFGAVSYFIIPGFGPAFFDPSAYAFLEGHGLWAPVVQQALAQNSLSVASGTVGSLPPYQFLACMPSLHMTHELVMLYYTRHDRTFFFAKLVGVLLSAVAVIVLGWHYLIDIFGGVGLALVSVAIAERARGWLFPAIFHESEPSGGRPYVERDAPTPADNEAARARGWVGVAIALTLLLSTLLRSDVALDIDVIGLRMALDHFDLLQHQPQPPGYLGYVWLLGWLRDFAGLQPFVTVGLAAQLASVLTVWFTFRAARAFMPDSWRGASLAAVLAATHPLVLYYAIDGQTHAAEGAAAAGLAWALGAYHANPTKGRALLLGACVAFGFAIRPTFVLFAIGPILLLLVKRPLHLALAAVPATLGSGAVALLTVAAAGGFEVYREATSALVTHTILRATSPLSPDADPRMIVDNTASIVAWALLLFLPLIVAVLLRQRRALQGLPIRLLAASFVPSVFFFLLTFCAEPGYLQPLLPLTCISAAAALTLDVDSRSRLFAGGLAAAQALIFLAGPSIAMGVTHWPTLGRIFDRSEKTWALLSAVTDGVPQGSSVLAVTDFGDQTFMRQLPFARPGSAVLFVHPEWQTVFETTTASIATADGWRAIPGPALLQDAEPREHQLDAQYDWLVVDPLASDPLREMLQLQTRCDIPSTRDQAVATKLPLRDCFPSGELRIGRHGVRWGSSAAPR